MTRRGHGWVELDGPSESPHGVAVVGIPDGYVISVHPTYEGAARSARGVGAHALVFLREPHEQDDHVWWSESARGFLVEVDYDPEEWYG